MTDPERLKLLYGPYVAPKCKRGDVLECEWRGREVKVGQMSDGLIQWPCALKTGRKSLILCGDLVRAVRTESEQSVAHHWGVSVTVVWQWRKALDVPRITEGTGRLYREYQPEKITEKAYNKMRETMRSTESRELQRRNKIGKPAHPKTAEALRRAARRKKSRDHRRAIAAAVSDWWERQPRPRDPVKPNDRLWNQQEDRLLGLTLDRHVAQMIGRTIASVRLRRKQLGIPQSRHSRLRNTRRAD